MNSQELRECPFCGGKASVGTIKYSGVQAKKEGWKQTTFFFVNCIKCGGKYQSIVGSVSPEEAAKHWNTRPIEDELRARIERLEAACRWLAKHCSTFDFIINEFDPMHKTYSIQQYLEWAEAAEEETHAPR